MISQQSSSPERTDNQLTTSEQLVERSFSQARLVCGASASTSFTGSGVLPCSIFTEISPRGSIGTGVARPPTPSASPPGGHSLLRPAGGAQPPSSAPPSALAARAPVSPPRGPPASSRPPRPRHGRHAHAAAKTASLRARGLNDKKISGARPCFLSFSRSLCPDLAHTPCSVGYSKATPGETRALPIGATASHTSNAGS